MNLLLLRPDSKKIEPWYLLWLLKFYRERGVFKSIAKKAVNQASINQTELGKLKIPLPPLPEQKKIAEILRTVDEAIEKTDEAIERTERLKKGLMQRLLTKGIKHERFKKTELGEIPEEWEVLTVGELIKEKIILRIQDGNHGELHPKTHEFSNSGIPFITANCIKNNKLDLSECKFLPDEVVRRLIKGFAKPGDVLLTHKGSIGLTAIIPENMNLVVLSPQVTYYRVNEKRLRSEFLYYVFQTDYFKRQILPLSKQSTRDYISLERQKKLKIPLPPFSEQKQISEILSTVDRKLELLRKRREKLERVKRGLMKDLLTGRRRVKA
jgi:type I restriction enzyme S subunit